MPRVELDERYSASGIAATPWHAARRILDEAEVYWLSTWRIDGGPHLTPVIGVWSDGTFNFCTGAREQKARNLADEPRCAVMTGTNELAHGLDVVLEGAATPRTDEEQLRSLADHYLDKYGREWAFEVRDGAFAHAGGGRAEVYELVPVAGYAFGRGPASHTRYRF